MGRLNILRMFYKYFSESSAINEKHKVQGTSIFEKFTSTACCICLLT